MTPSEERDFERLERRAAARARQKEWFAESAREALAAVGRSLWQAVKGIVGTEKSDGF